MYKVGDEVLIKAKICKEILEGVYEARTKNAGSIAVSDEEIVEKTYEQGLADAWELAKKIYEMTCTQAEKIFDVEGGFWDVIRDFTYEETLAKIEAYEKEKSEIKVGDVIKYDNNLCVAVSVFNSTLNAMFADGGTINVFISQCKKTGKHIDIESLLKQIGE